MGNMMMAVAAAAESGEFEFQRGMEKSNILRIFLHDDGDRFVINGGKQTILLNQISSTSEINNTILLDSIHQPISTTTTTTKTTKTKTRRKTRTRNNNRRSNNSRSSNSNNNNSNNTDDYQEREHDNDDDDDDGTTTVDWNLIKAVKIHGYLSTFLVKNPSALESVFQEIVSLPTIERIRIVIPFLVPNLRRFLRIMRNLFEMNNTTTTTSSSSRMSLTGIKLDNRGESILLQGNKHIRTVNNNTDDDNTTSNADVVKTLDIGLHASPAYAADTDNLHRLGSLHDPFLKELLNIGNTNNSNNSQTDRDKALVSLKAITWNGCRIMADTFQQLCGNEYLTELTISRVMVDAFHVTTLVEALTPPPSTTTSKSSSLSQPKVTGRKRKRSNSIITTTALSLPSLQKLVFDDIKIQKDSFLALCTMMECNASIQALTLHDIAVRPSFSLESELWGPIFRFVSANSTLQTFIMKDIYNMCVHDDGEGHLIQLDEEYTRFMATGLHKALNQYNHTLTKIDFGFRPAHPSIIMELLHLNILGLRPYMGEFGSPIYDDTDDDDDDEDEEEIASVHVWNKDLVRRRVGTPFTKQEFHRSLIHAVEMDHKNNNANDDDDDNNKDTPLVPSLFRLFQENPTLVDYLA